MATITSIAHVLTRMRISTDQCRIRCAVRRMRCISTADCFSRGLSMGVIEFCSPEGCCNKEGEEEGEAEIKAMFGLKGKEQKEGEGEGGGEEGEREEVEGCRGETVGVAGLEDGLEEGEMPPTTTLLAVMFALV